VNIEYGKGLKHIT